MDSNITNITVDLATSNNFGIVKAVQGDMRTRFVHITLLDNQVEYDFSRVYPVLRGTKPDGTTIFNVCTVSDNNQIIVELTEQMLAAPGMSTYEISLYSVLKDLSEEKKVITSFPFTVFVNKAAFDPNVVTSADEFTAIADVIGNNTVLQECLDEIVASREAAKVSETNARISEINAKNSETAAKASETRAKSSETNAKTSETNAKNSETAANISETNAKNSETKAKVSETNAKNSETKSKTSETNAKASETNAKNSETAAKTSEVNAKDSETKSKTSEINAANSAESAENSYLLSKSYAVGTNNVTRPNDATDNSKYYSEQSKNQATASAASATAASVSENIATAKATESANSATSARSWTVGDTNTRSGETTDNAKYYSEQSKSYANSWKGSLLPKGTLSFSQLPTADNVAGHMYNISNAFETDSRFKDGAGYAYPAGTNVYWTVDGKWDCLSGALTMELTIAEYNALSEAEKMNGTIYYIKDVDNSIPLATENVDGLMSSLDKQKLNGIENGATRVIIDNAISTTSQNAIQNKAITNALNTNITNHNSSSAAHTDIRELIAELTARLNTLADSDDTTLDQLNEIISNINSNRSLIENIASSKVDKVSDKTLSTNDYTTAEKEKLNGIASGAEVNVQPDWNITDNRSDAFIKNKPTIGNGTITIKQAGVSKGTFSMNQTGNTTIELTDSNTTYSAATQSANGLMSAADKKKLDEIASGANTYSLPLATESIRGGVKIGYTQNGKNYPVRLNSNEQMYVNVDLTPESIGVAKNSGYDCYGKCTTDSNIANKTVTVSGNFELRNGVRVFVQFTKPHTVSQSSGLTLNVNGTGAKYIKVGESTSTYFNISTTIPCEFIYSEPYWILINNAETSTFYDSMTHGFSVHIPPSTYGKTEASKAGGTVSFSSCAHGLVPLATNGGQTETSEWGFNLGSSTHFWGQVYATKSAISTSDRNKKSCIGNLDPRYLELFDMLSVKKFVLNGGCDSLTTTKNKRYHLGVIAQDVEEIVRDLGLTSDDFGGVCSEYFACYGSFKASIHGGWREKKDGKDYSDNVYNWKHRNDTGVKLYEIYNEIIEEQIKNLHIDNYRKNIGYIMIEDNSKLTKDQPPITVNSISLVDFSGNITTLSFTDFLRYYTVDDIDFENPLSDVVINEDGSATISFNRMYGCAWLKLSETIDISKYQSVIIDVDYIGEYTMVFIPDGEYQNANPYDRDRNDQILYNYSFRYDELFNLTAYTLQETRKEFHAYKEETQRAIEYLTEKVDMLLGKAGE